MNRIAKKMIKWLSYTLAVLIVLAATLVSLSRMLTPYLNHHKNDFEKWASDELHAPVKIGRVHITWYYHHPLLTFDKVAFLNAKNNQINFTIQQIKVNLQVIPSLLHWQPIPQYIKIFGANITLHELKNNQISIEGDTPVMVIDIASQTNKPNPFAEWLFAQPRLVLDDIRLTYIPLDDQKKEIMLDKLVLSNNDQNHAISGNAILQQEAPLDVQFLIQLSGPGTDFYQMKTQAYLYLEGISLPQWLSKKTWNQLQLVQGIGSARLWLNWDQSILQSIQSELQFYDLEIKALKTKKIIEISRLNGKFGWEKNGDQQMITGEDILIDFPEHLWPNTGFSIKLTKLPTSDYTLNSLQVNYLDLADSIQLAFVSGLVPGRLQNTLDQLDINGDLRNVSIQFPAALDQNSNKVTGLAYPISAEFHDLSFNAWQKLPKISQLTGVIHWNGHQGDIQLDSKDSSIVLDKLFNKPLTFRQLKGNLHIDNSVENSWQIQGNQILVADDYITAKAALIVDISENKPLYLDLNTNFVMSDTTPITQYLPTKILEPALNQWLTNTFYGGQITNGQLIIHGNMDEFPFDQNQGQFLVSADIHDLDFEYAPEWPGIKHLDGKLIFSGHKMVADVASGMMVNVPIQNVHAEIPYIGADQPQILNIQSTIHDDLKQTAEYINQSPLQKKFGKTFSELQLSGPMQLDLGLSIPLKTPEKTDVIGDLTVMQGALNVAAWSVKLTDIKGNLHFTQDDIAPSDWQAIFLDKPIVLTWRSINQPSQPSVIQVTFQSSISKAELQKWFTLPKTHFFDGTINYSAQLNLTSEEQPAPSQLIISSDLQGATIHLPDIYGKTSEMSRPSQLIVNMNKQDQGIGVQFNYAKLISTAITLNQSNRKWGYYSGEIRFGDGLASFQAKPGLRISGQFDQWDLTTWQKYIAQVSATDQFVSSSNMDFSFIREVDLSARQLSGLGLVLHNAHFQATQNANNWQVSIGSGEMVGQITIPRSLKNTIQAKFQRLFLSSDSTGHSNINPKTLPPIDFEGQEVHYNDMNFGRVAFHLEPITYGMSIESLHCDADSYSLNATGEWRSQRSNALTHLQGTVTTNDVGKLLSRLGAKSPALVESSGNAQFDLNWNGAPFQPELASVVGNLSLKLGAGRIIDLSHSTDAKMGIGKMLNLFNLSYIPRRLTLNFKDFEKGYIFDSMQGHFDLQKGSLFTQDTVFEGPLARIEIKGRIGYVAKDYDVKFSITPHGMTSSLPLVATVVGGPVAGAATWLVDRVVGGAVSNVITHHYTVSGPWSRPDWQEGK